MAVLAKDLGGEELALILNLGKKEWILATHAQISFLTLDRVAIPQIMLVCNLESSY